MQSDEMLARNIQQGQIADLRTLVERYHSPLLRYLYRLTGGDALLAEDLVQETFVRVIRAIHQYRYPRAFKPWLYAIATNLSRDYYKRLATRQTVAMTDTMLNQPDVYADVKPETIIVNREAEHQVAEALSDLPDHQREVVILRYYEELSLGEIADALHIPVGTVKSRLSLGLKRLRTQLVERERMDYGT